jgi:hypothetical protein
MRESDERGERGRMRVTQRVLNDLYRTILSCCRMIRLLAHPLPPSPVSKLDRRHTGRLRKRDNLLTGEEEGSNTRAREPGPL